MKAAKVLHDCVDEMYPMGKGVFITNPDVIILECGDGYMTRRQIKHIVEQRKAEGGSAKDIKQLLNRVSGVITDFDLEIPNRNPRYPGSIMRIKVFKSWERGIAVVMNQPTKNGRGVITAYPYRVVYAYFLLLQKLNASAAGKTPHPKDILMG